MRQDPDQQTYGDSLYESYNQLNYEKGLAAWFMRKSHQWSEKKYSPDNHFSKVLLEYKLFFCSSSSSRALVPWRRGRQSMESKDELLSMDNHHYSCHDQTCSNHVYFR